MTVPVLTYGPRPSRAEFEEVVTAILADGVERESKRLRQVLKAHGWHPKPTEFFLRMLNLEARGLVRSRVRTEYRDSNVIRRRFFAKAEPK